MKRSRAKILAEIRALRADKDNYVTTVVRADPYSLVAEEMMKKVPNSEVFEGMTFPQIRAYCKKPLMTALYNSRNQPIEAFGEDTDELAAFYATINDLFPGAVSVMEALNDAWDNKALFHTWETPDGHTSHVKVMEKVHGILSSGGMDFAYTYNNNEQSDVRTSLSPNFTHSMDGFVVRHIVENADCEVFHVHDDVKAHPNNMTQVTELYKDAFEVMIDERPLDKFLGQDLKIDYTPILDGLKEASYSLC